VGDAVVVLMTSRTARMATRPAHPGDVAQAQLFVALLQAELAEVEALVAAAERHWLQRFESDGDQPGKPTETVQRLRGRHAELRRLLSALHARFLHE
jgi:hypothetical protein